MADSPSENSGPGSAKKSIDFNVTRAGDDFEEKMRNIDARNNTKANAGSKKSSMVRDSYLSTRELVKQRSSMDSGLPRRHIASTSDDEFLSHSRRPEESRPIAVPSRISRMIENRERQQEMRSKSMHAGESDGDSDSRDGDSHTVKSLPAGGGNKKFFHSMTEEVLFKSMKRIRAPSGASSSGMQHRPRTAGAQGGRGVNNNLGGERSMVSTRTAGTAATGATGATRRKSLAANSTASLQRLTASKSTGKVYGRGSVYALDDEVKNCTFKPKLRSSRGGAGGRDKHRDDSSDDEREAKAKEASSGAFFERQAADERRRRVALETTRGKEAYEAILDKKFCPNCGGKKSYDEYKEKKKKCQNCMVDYVSKVVWNSRMSKTFFKRDSEFMEAKKKHVETLKNEVVEKLQQYATHQYDPETRKVVEVHENQFKKNARWNAEMEEEFLERLEECNAKKEERFNKIKEEMTYSFAPTITERSTKKKKKGDNDDEDAGEDDEEGGEGGKPKNTVKIFLSRMERDLEEYRKIHPVMPKKTKPTAPRFRM